MLTHRAGDAVTSRFRGNHIAAIADMRAATSLIAPKVVGAHDLTLMFGDEAGFVCSHPVLKCALSAHVPIKRIGFPLADDRANDPPNVF